MRLIPREVRNAYSLLHALQREYPGLTQAEALGLPLWEAYLRLAHRFTTRPATGVEGGILRDWSTGHVEVTPRE